MAHESTHFRRALRSRPQWLLPAAGEVWRRLVGASARRLRARLTSDVHAVGRRRLALQVAHDGVLQWPTCPPPVGPAFFDTTTFADRDPETALAGHRWRACVPALTAPADAALAAVADCAAWLRHPPPRTSVAWEPYSVSERVANLVILLSTRPELREAIDADLLRRGLVDHAAWVAVHLEDYGPGRTNNHVLNNARALILAGRVLGDAATRRAGVALMDEWAGEIVDAEGVVRERSSHYQAVVTGWLLDAARWAGPTDPAGERLHALALRAATTTAWLAAALGTEAPIGDVSPDLSPAATLLRLRCLHPEVMTPPLALAQRRGLWTVTATSRGLVVTCTPSRWPERHPTHGHQDIGAFVWRWEGDVVLGDAGRSTYGADAEAGDQISPLGHSSLTVDSLSAVADSVSASRPWFPHPYSRASLRVEVQEDGRTQRLTHDGWRRLGLGAHVRTLRLCEDGLDVIDELAGQGTHEVDVRWHWGRTWRPESDGVRVSDGMRRVSCVADWPGVTPVSTWQTVVDGPVYGHRETCHVLHTRARATLPCVLVTRFRVH